MFYIISLVHTQKGICYLNRELYAFTSEVKILSFVFQMKVIKVCIFPLMIVPHVPQEHWRCSISFEPSTLFSEISFQEVTYQFAIFLLSF